MAWWLAAGAAYGALSDRKESSESAAIEREAGLREARRLRRNADLKELEREDFLKLSSEDQTDKEQEVGSLVSNQKAAMAAQGIDVDSDLGLGLEYDEREKNRRDVQTMRNNTWRQALGLSLEIEDTRAQARDAEATGLNKARATISSGNRRFAAGAIKTVGAANRKIR